MLRTWIAMVLALRHSASAICWLVLPAATSRSTCTSRLRRAAQSPAGQRVRFALAVAGESSYACLAFSELCSVLRFHSLTPLHAQQDHQAPRTRLRAPRAA